MINISHSKINDSNLFNKVTKSCLTRKNPTGTNFWNLCIENITNSSDASTKCQSFNLTLAKKNVNFGYDSISLSRRDLSIVINWFPSNYLFSVQLNETSMVFSSTLDYLKVEQNIVLYELKSFINTKLDEFIQTVQLSFNCLSNPDQQAIFQSISNIIESFRNEQILLSEDLYWISRNSISNCIKRSSDIFQQMLANTSCDSSLIRNALNDLDINNSFLITRLNIISAKISNLSIDLNQYEGFQDLNSNLTIVLNYWNDFTIFKQRYIERLVKNQLENLLNNCNIKPM